MHTINSVSQKLFRRNVALEKGKEKSQKKSVKEVEESKIKRQFVELYEKQCPRSLLHKIDYKIVLLVNRRASHPLLRANMDRVLKASLAETKRSIENLDFTNKIIRLKNREIIKQNFEVITNNDKIFKRCIAYLKRMIPIDVESSRAVILCYQRTIKEGSEVFEFLKKTISNCFHHRAYRGSQLRRFSETLEKNMKSIRMMINEFFDFACVKNGVYEDFSNKLYNQLYNRTYIKYAMGSLYRLNILEGNFGPYFDLGSRTDRLSEYLRMGDVDAILAPNRANGVCGALEQRGREIGFVHLQGRRRSQEDASLVTNFDLKVNGEKQNAELFAIFDGHGGDGVANYCKQRIVHHLKQQIEKFYIRDCHVDEAIYNALSLACVYLDEEMSLLRGENRIAGGATATLAMIIHDQLYVANVGDARTFLDLDGVVRPMTVDALASDPESKREVELRGGTIQELSGHDDWRVNSILQPSTSFGEFWYEDALTGEIIDSGICLGGKKNVSPRPMITKLDISRIRKGQLILTCDGVFEGPFVDDDRLPYTKSPSPSIEQVASAAHYVRENLHSNRDATSEEVAKAIGVTAYLNGSLDNISVMVVKIDRQVGREKQKEAF